METVIGIEEYQMSVRPTNAILIKNKDNTLHLPMIKEDWMLQDLIELIRLLGEEPKITDRTKSI